eukprot:344210_1
MTMTSSQTHDEFKKIDDALAQYYERLRVKNYYDENGVGLFLNYIKQEQLDDVELLEEDLSDYADPSYCSYLLPWTHLQFPIPVFALIPDDQTEALIFYVVQYCYKYNKPPSDEYIQQILIPKCNGTCS